jgi:hypothetical protein
MIELKEKQLKEEKKLQRILYNNSEKMDNDIENTNTKNKKSQGKNRSASAKVNLVMQKKSIFNDISNNKIKYNQENKKTYQEIIDEFYEFLGLYSTQEYRSKMRGYNMSPVKTVSNLIHEKSFLSGEGNRSKSFRNEEIEEINQIVENNKNERLKKKLKDKEKIKKILYKEKLKLFNINNQRLKITVDKKMKKKTYLDLMREQKEEKSEILLMQQQQENILKNKLKEKELKKSKEKERLKELKSLNIINNNYYKKEEYKYNDIRNKQININERNNKNRIFNDDRDIGQLHISEIKIKNDIKKEEVEEEQKRNDKNQIWWDKLEKYDINDLGMNEEEKDIFINSDNSEDNDLISKISKSKINSHNNSFGGLISENSLQKSSSIIDLNNNNNNVPVQLPPINNSSSLKKGNNVIELKSYNDYNQKIKINSLDTNKNQNKKRVGLDEIKDRIMKGNNNKYENNNRYKNMFKNNSSGAIKTTVTNISEKNMKNIKSNNLNLNKQNDFI